MLDVLGTILLIALAAIFVATLVPRREGHGVTRARLAIALSAWFIVAASLGLAGAFASSRLPAGVAVGIAVLVPVIALAGRVARAQGHGIPLATLVALNSGRVFGVAFLMLYSAGRLPFTFAHSAGWGDIATGLLAIPVAWAIQRQVTGWRWFTGAWNVLGMADLLIAVTLGVGSAPGSLIRFNFECAWLGRNRDVPLGAGPGVLRAALPAHARRDLRRPRGLRTHGQRRVATRLRWAGTPSASRLIGCVRRIDESGRSARAARASLYR